MAVILLWYIWMTTYCYDLTMRLLWDYYEMTMRLHWDVYEMSVRSLWYDFDIGIGWLYGVKSSQDEASFIILKKS